MRKKKKPTKQKINKYKTCLTLSIIKLFFTFLGADLISGDGIYSRYLTQYHDAGRYSFDVTVHDNRKGAFTIRNTPIAMPRKSHKIGQIKPQSCCGSDIQTKIDDRIPTGAFWRATKGPVIHLLSVPPSDVDLMPPASIRNLKIQVLPKSGMYR